MRFYFHRPKDIFLQPTFDRKRETIILCQKYPLTKCDDLNTQQIETLLFSNLCTSLFSTNVKLMQNGKDFVTTLPKPYQYKAGPE